MAMYAYIINKLDYEYVASYLKEGNYMVSDEYSDTNSDFFKLLIEYSNDSKIGYKFHITDFLHDKPRSPFIGYTFGGRIEDIVQTVITLHHQGARTISIHKLRDMQSVKLFRHKFFNDCINLYFQPIEFDNINDARIEFISNKVKSIEHGKSVIEIVNNLNYMASVNPTMALLEYDSLYRYGVRD